MLIIRADANNRIGAGHMMRCISIAKAYQSVCSADFTATDRGSEQERHPTVNTHDDNQSSASYIDKESSVLFICADAEGARLPREAGFAVQVLHTNSEIMEDELIVLLPLIEDLLAAFIANANKRISSDAFSSEKKSAVRDILRQNDSASITIPNTPVTLLVDSYRVTDNYLTALSNIVPVFYMDDFGAHAYPVQGIINYNFYADEANYKMLYPHLMTSASSDQSAQSTTAIPLTSDKEHLSCSGCTAQDKPAPPPCTALLGPMYAPVRDEFSNISFTVSERVRNILILCGGGGDGSIPLRIYKTLSNECDQDITWHIVLGKYAADNLPAGSPLRLASHLVYHTDVKNMAALMVSCDLCITAGGSTVYELCAVGLPFVTFSMADNQNENCRYLDTHDIADFAGSMETEPEMTLANLSKSIQRLFSDYSLRQEKSLRQKTLVDGEGAKRIANLF